jgi:hypothetical protein
MLWLFEVTVSKEVHAERRNGRQMRLNNRDGCNTRGVRIETPLCEATQNLRQYEILSHPDVVGRSGRLLTLAPPSLPSPGIRSDPSVVLWGLRALFMTTLPQATQSFSPVSPPCRRDVDPRLLYRDPFSPRCGDHLFAIHEVPAFPFQLSLPLIGCTLGSTGAGSYCLARPLNCCAAPPKCGVISPHHRE